MILDESENVFTISHLLNTAGQVLEAWDLYVGARIVLLGRVTTLMQASFLTSQWVEMHEKNLLKVKNQLHNELLKYEVPSKAKAAAVGGITPSLKAKTGSSSQSLRQLMNQVQELKKRLAKYRPDLVRKLAITTATN